MSITERPRAFIYKCDNPRCDSAQHVQENAAGHYTNSTPPGWTSLRVSRNGENSQEFLFCESCSRNFVFKLQTLPIGETQ